MARIISRKSKLILFLILLLVVGFLTTSSVSYHVSKMSLRARIASNELPLTSDNIYSEIQRDLISPILISSLMANDTFLKDWVLSGEKNEEQVSKYLKEIMVKYNAFTSFFVSEKTRNYYHTDGILKKVKPDVERDEWYFRVREMASDYEINVDPDMANRDVMTIFINHRVYDYQGQYIGVVGVGLAIDSVVRLIDHYDSKYNRNIFFADQHGNIMLHGMSFPENIDNIKDMEGLAPIANDILSADRLALEYSRQGKLVILHTRFVPELNWRLLVEQMEDVESIKDIRNAFLTNLAFCLLITSIVVLLTMLTINAYERVNRQQKEEIVQQHEKLLEQTEKLTTALDEVKTLGGMLPICSSCKKIRDDKGYWQQIESYIQSHSEAQFSHGICPDCAKRMYSEYIDDEDSDTQAKGKTTT
jgi:Cache domain